MTNWIIVVTLFPSFSCVRKLLPDIHSLPSIVNFACALIAPDGACLRKLIDLITCIGKPHFLIRITKDGRADKLVWLKFLSAFNCLSFSFSALWSDSHQLNLFNDASGALDYGAIFGNHWHTFVSRVSLLSLWRQRRERETLGTRLIGSDIRQTRACATFCFGVHCFDTRTGAGIKRKKKNALGLALSFMLT